MGATFKVTRLPRGRRQRCKYLHVPARLVRRQLRPDVPAVAPRSGGLLYVVEPGPRHPHWPFVAGCHLRESIGHLNGVLPAKAREPRLGTCACTGGVRVVRLARLSKVVGVRVAARHGRVVVDRGQEPVVPTGDALALLLCQVCLAAAGRPDLHWLDRRTHRRRRWQLWGCRRRWRTQLDVGAPKARRRCRPRPLLVPASIAAAPAPVAVAHPPRHVSVHRSYRGSPPHGRTAAPAVGLRAAFFLPNKVRVAGLRPVGQSRATLGLASRGRVGAGGVDVHAPAGAALVLRQHPHIVRRGRRGRQAGRQRGRWKGWWHAWRRRRRPVPIRTRDEFQTGKVRR